MHPGCAHSPIQIMLLAWEFRKHSYQLLYCCVIKGYLDIGADSMPGLDEINHAGFVGWEEHVLCFPLSCPFLLEMGKLIHLLGRKCTWTEPASGFFHPLRGLVVHRCWHSFQWVGWGEETRAFRCVLCDLQLGSLKGRQQFAHVDSEHHWWPSVHDVTC